MRAIKHTNTENIEMAKYTELKISSFQKFTKSEYIHGAYNADLAGYECGRFTHVRILKSTKYKGLWDVKILWEDAGQFETVSWGHGTLEDAKYWIVQRSDKADQLAAMEAANDDAFYAAHPHLERI